MVLKRHLFSPLWRIKKNVDELRQKKEKADKIIVKSKIPEHVNRMRWRSFCLNQIKLHKEATHVSRTPLSICQRLSKHHLNREE